jgi:X-Pro dipeptidyl-peptidase
MRTPPDTEVLARRPVGRLIAALTAVLLAVGAMTAATAPAQADEPDDDPDGELTAESLGLFGDSPDGHQTEPIFDVGDAIQEEVWVESSIDSDGDGMLDRIGVRIRRPDATDDGLQVPAIIAPSPYNGGTRSSAWVNNYLTELGINVFGESLDTPPDIPYSPNFFLARGYATIDADMAGTNTSTGCPSTGGDADVLSMKAVVEWINGQGTAYTTKFGDETVDATWSTGDSAMIGVSYVGTLPTGVAATGVEGLKTIVPIAAISSWYNYFRANGTVKTGYFDPLAGAVLTRDDYRECDDEMIEVVQGAERRTGSYNQFWDDRNYLNDVDQIDASVFLVHGLTDWNVHTQHAGQLWDELTEHDVDRKLWWHRAAHTSPANVDNARWAPVLHRWFDHWLYGLDTGVMDEDMVDVQSVHDGSWTTYEDWPVPGTQDTRLYLADDTSQVPGMLSPSVPKGPPSTTSFTEQYTGNAATFVGNAFEDRSHRRVFLSPVLEEDVRISGTPNVRLRTTASGDAHVAAMLVDYSADGAAGNNQIVTRGWMDLKSAHTLWRERTINPQQRYVVDVDTAAKDYVFRAGRRIGVVVTGNDNSTFAPTGASPADFELDLRVSHIELPVVGGRSALGF